MTALKKEIPSKALKIVAEKIIAKYPKTFRDDEGRVFCEDTHTLFLKRDPKSLKNQITKKRRISKSLQLGCNYWQPEEYPNQSDDTEIQQKRKISSSLSPQDENVYTYLEETYAELKKQRVDIINGLEIKILNREWPALFLRNGLVWHYTKLTGRLIFPI